MDKDACNNLKKLNIFQSKKIKRLLKEVAHSQRVEFLSDYLSDEENRLELRGDFCNKCEYSKGCNLYALVSEED